MNALGLKIKDKIAQHGSLPFSEYMALCLFEPEHGYYSGLQEIGVRGDFVTAPELGPYFAEAVGRFIAPELQRYQKPVMLELGGGTGKLAFDLLHFLRLAGSLPERYLILEKSPSLQKLQQQKLADLDFVKIEWLQEIQESQLEGIILANEFFDALPIERFVKTQEGIEQTFVDWQNGQFIETGEGERFEKCVNLDAILTPIVGAFKKALALIIDYGEEVVSRSTLRAYAQHHLVGIFDKPGECDLTADVDFTHLAEILLHLGWKIGFLKPQNQFLLEQGVLPVTGIDVEDYALKQLLDPRLMGEKFKVFTASLHRET